MVNSYPQHSLSQYKRKHVMGPMLVHLGCGNIVYTYELSVKLWIV